MNYSSLLFAMPSFWEGVARTVDVGGTLMEFNSSPTKRQADGFAIWSDWRAAGEDIQFGMDEFSTEHPEVTIRG